MAGCEPSRRTAVAEITGMLVTALPIQIFFTQSNYNTIVLAQHTATHTESNQWDHCLGICALFLKKQPNFHILILCLYFSSALPSPALSSSALNIFHHLLLRHMKGSQNMSNAPIPPVDFMSGTLSSELGGTLLSEDEEEEEVEEEERYAMVSKNLCGFEYTPGHSMDGLEAAGTFFERGKTGVSLQSLLVLSRLLLLGSISLLNTIVQMTPRPKFNNKLAV